MGATVFVPTVMEITAPSLEYGLLAPFILIFAGACLGVLVEALFPRPLRFSVQMAVTFIAIVAAIFMVVRNWVVGTKAIAAVGSVAIDGPTYFIWLMVLVLGGLSFLVFADRKVDAGVSAFAPQAAAVPGTLLERQAVEAKVEHTEVYPLAMFALAGMMLFPASNDLITMFVALEMLSLPLYLLCGLSRRRRLLSQESALKYFMLGALSSGFFIYGIALLYGYAGSFQLSAIDEALRTSTHSDGLLIAGMGLLGIGLLFKVGAVPFHSWTPDVYVGAPTAVTGFMASCTKIAAIGALLRVFYVGLGADRWDWQPVMSVVAIATMAVGCVLAITQTDVKRMLAYSSVAHAGFLLVAFVGANQAATGKGEHEISSLAAILFYLAAYGLSTVGAFAVLTMVRGRVGESAQLSAWSGLGRRSPVVAGVFTLFLLSFAGIPLTSGFMGKWTVFAAAWGGGAYWLVIIAVLMSLVAAFFYIRVIVLMFFGDPGDDLAEAVTPGWTTLVAIGVGVVATVALGVFPGPVLDLAQHAGEFLR